MISGRNSENPYPSCMEASQYYTKHLKQLVIIVDLMIFWLLFGKNSSIRKSESNRCSITCPVSAATPITVLLKSRITLKLNFEIFARNPAADDFRILLNRMSNENMYNNLLKLNNADDYSKLQLFSNFRVHAPFRNFSKITHIARDASLIQ
jgi:hypothetical protein